VPGGFSALSLKLDATQHSFHHNTQHPHSLATAATLHHHYRIDPESDTWRFLGTMPAIQRYKIHSQKAIIHEVTELNGVGCCRSQSSIADSATTAGPTLDLIARRLLGLTTATQWYKGRLCRIKTHEIADPCGSCLYTYPGAPRARWRIPPQPLLRFCTGLREIVGPDASYTAV